MAYLKLKDLHNKVVTITRIFPGQWTSFVDGQPVRKDTVTPAEKALKNEKGYSAWTYGVGSKVTLDGEEFGLSFSYAQIKNLKDIADVENDADLVGKSFKVKVDKKGDRTSYTFALKSETKKEESNEVNLEDLPF